MKILRVGIAGFGVVGKRRKIFIDQNNKLKIVAISDITFKEELNQRNDIFFLKNYKSLFHYDLDIIFICLPNKFASEATILALKKNVHIFCEKPPAKNLNDLKKVIKVKERYPKLKLKYGFNHRYHDSFIQANRIISSKKYGKLINIRAVYGKSAIIPNTGGWRSKKSEAGGGILLDQGIHILDMILFFMDDIDKIKSFVSNDYWKHDVEDNVYTLLKDKKNRVAILHSTATEWQHKFRLELTLSECLIELSGILSGSKSYGNEEFKLINKLQQNKSNPRINIKKRYLKDHSWKREVDEFVQIVSQNKRVENGNSKQAYKVMNIIDKIYKADNDWIRKK